MMAIDDEKIKNLQVLIKGFPVKYEDLVTALFSYYLEAFTNYNSKEKTIDSFLDNCTHLSKDEKQFIRIILIMDFDKNKIKEADSIFVM
ncbi:MAG: hypothetical protein H7336_16095 [Bacteriovorax sp.]|nr:hypothetical protein [Bacteriovorax sp.]